MTNSVASPRPDVLGTTGMLPAEVLERQIENVDKILPQPTPERLTAPARIGAY